MTSAVPANPAADHTELRHVLRSAVQLGVIQSVLVAIFAVLQPKIEGPTELVVLGLILVIGVALTIVLPGTWTKARSIEGIAGAAGIGLAAAVVFLLIDVAILQPAGIWTNRWLAIGGGSNWWYHPIWWMVGTFMPWMGAWVLANQFAKSGSTNPAALVGGTVVAALVIMAAATALKFPGATAGLGTFAVSILPALAVMVLVTGLGARRS
jgi:hypothetical protein